MDIVGGSVDVAHNDKLGIEDLNGIGRLGTFFEQDINSGVGNGTVVESDDINSCWIVGGKQ